LWEVTEGGFLYTVPGAPYYAAFLNVMQRLARGIWNFYDRNDTGGIFSGMILTAVVHIAPAST